MGSTSKYIHWDDPSVEPPVPDEAAKIAELKSVVTSNQQKNFCEHRHGFRGTHVKTQGVVKGTLTVFPDVPPELAHGIASPANAQKEHAVAIRFANEPIWLQDDRTAGPRGLGIKIFDVQGDFMDPVGEETRTQDLLFNNVPMIELGDVTRCLEIFKIRNQHFHEPAKIDVKVGTRMDALLQLAPKALPNHHYLAYPMYSQSAYRWGPYVVKYALFPALPDMKKLEESHKIQKDSDADQHSKWLQEYFHENRAEYNLCVQPCENIDEQPVEDGTKEWDEKKYPFIPVAKVVIPAGQDSFDAKRRIFWEDKMKLNAWYGLEEMRPLGSINRLRKGVYPASREFRDEKNATESVGIKSVDEIP